MIFAFWLALNPLWYAVTNETVPLSINTPLWFRASTPLVCRMLNNSVALAGAPALKWTKTINSSLNRRTCWKYCLIARRFQRISCQPPTFPKPPSTNLAPMPSSSFAKRLHIQRLPSTGNTLRVSFKKLHPSLVSAGLSANEPMSTAGTASSSANINSTCNLSLTASTKPCTTVRMPSMSNFLSSINTWLPFHDTVPSALVVYRIRMPYVRWCNKRSIGVILPPKSRMVMNRFTIASTPSTIAGALRLASASVEPCLMSVSIDRRLSPCAR